MILKKYLLKNFTQTFLPIFLTLFSITSIISLIKIASLTSIIEINVSELLLLYFYNSAKILFYTLPISFIFALSLSLAKLSQDYELLIFSSFGQNPIKILKIFIPITAVFSLILLILSMDTIPKFTYLNSKFIAEKKSEAKFNIKASQFGQEFGDWLIFIKEDKDDKFQDVKLLKKDSNNDKFIIASQAQVNNENGDLNLELNNGKSFVISDTIEQINYEKMTLLDPKDDFSYHEFTNVFDYWKRILTDRGYAEDFSFNLLISLFPLLSILFLITFGFFNPRYEKNKTILFTTVLTVVFFIFIKQLNNLNPFSAMIIIPIVTVISSIVIYNKTVKKLY